MSDRIEHKYNAIYDTWVALWGKHPEWSAGQAAFNALCRVDPVLAERVRGTAADPFNDNSRLTAFWETVGWAA